jgi:hypothetical protein
MAQGDRMTWIHGNRHNECEACEHCEGIANQHEIWCAVVNPMTEYAFAIVSNAFRLTEWDRLSLHSLGVLWSAAGAR